MNNTAYKVSYWLFGILAVISFVLFNSGNDSNSKYESTVYYIFCIGIFSISVNILLFGIKNHIDYLKESKENK